MNEWDIFTFDLNARNIIYGYHEKHRRKEIPVVCSFTFIHMLSSELFNTDKSINQFYVFISSLNEKKKPKINNL